MVSKLKGPVRSGTRVTIVLNRDSGTLYGKRVVRGGRARVRATLYMATVVATRENPTIKMFY